MILCSTKTCETMSPSKCRRCDFAIRKEAYLIAAILRFDTNTNKNLIFYLAIAPCTMYSEHTVPNYSFGATKKS